MAILNDITLGQYYPADSLLHQLDPRTKIIVMLTFMSAIVMIHHLARLGLAAILLLIVIAISRLPVALVLRNLRPFLWLFLLTVIFHLLLTSQGKLLITIPYLGIKVTLPGLITGIIYSLRLAILILSAALLTLTTSPMELTDALDRFLKPLQKIGVSTHEFTMMITLSLRFIPTLLLEADKLRKAQLSRGATFQGNIFQRVKSVIPLILPLFISVFRRADDLALAMDARCYGPSRNRTSFKMLTFQKNDYLVLAGTLVIIILFAGDLLLFR